MVQLKEGDRTLLDHGEQTVVTPQGKDNINNFGPASSRDDIVNTCQRPGGETPKGTLIDTIKGVTDWYNFMAKQNVKHVFILLSDNELEDYQSPGLIAAYESVGVTPHHIPIAKKGSYGEIMTELSELYDRGEKAVAHCTHGMGRSGRVAAGWLVHKYGLSMDDATEEVLDAARMHGVERMGAPEQLKAWIEG